jgi:hypothetical protein
LLSDDTLSEVCNYNAFNASITRVSIAICRVDYADVCADSSCDDFDELKFYQSLESGRWQRHDSGVHEI